MSKPTSIIVNKSYNNDNVDKVLTKPPLKTIKMDELLSAMNAMGFVVKSIRGSHYKFSHPLCTDVIIPIVPKPHGGRNEVKQGYIKNIQDKILEINQKGNII